MKFNIVEVLSPNNLYLLAAAICQMDMSEYIETVAFLVHISNDIVTSQNFIHAVKGLSDSINHLFIG